MSRNKRSSAIMEHLVSELKSSRSVGRVNTSHLMESKKSATKTPVRDSELEKHSAKKVQKNISSAKSKKKRLPESDKSKGRKASDKSSTHHGADDIKVRHSYNTNFKKVCPLRNGKISFKLSNSKSLTSSNFPVSQGGESSSNLGGKNNLSNNTNPQLFKPDQSKSNTRSSWPNQSQSISSNKSQESESKTRELSPKRLSIQSEPSQKSLKKPASGAVCSKSQDAVSEYKPKNDVSSRVEHKSGDKRCSSPGPGLHQGRRNISDRVINRIKADKKFQAKVKTLIANGSPAVNKSLLNEDAESEPPVGDNVMKDGDNADEEMDWETSDQENMIEHIKTIRKNLNPSENISSEFALQSKNSFKILSDNVLLVLDTNVFISCLSFIRDIRDAVLPDLGLPNIFIPWAVLRELDHLKVATSRQLARSAVRAIQYINETFSSNHPRVTGQSFEDFCLMKNSACDCTDDEILNVCMHLKMTDNRRKIMLITNDRNLESKALVSGVQAYSKQRFVDEIINKNKVPEHEENDHRLTVVKYTLYPKLKLVMKIALEKVVESELKKAFGRTWLHIVVRKPPWNLNQVFECFLRHWRSVFTFIFEKELYHAIEDAKKMFMSADSGSEKGRQFSNLIQTSADLLESVKHQISVKAKSASSPDYAKIIEHLSTALQEIELLREANNKLTQEQSSDVQMPNSVPIEMEDINIGEPPVSGSQLCKEEVKALFQVIWNQVQSFCLRVTELASNYGVAGPDVVEQVKCQFPQVLHKLEELIQNIEKIISLEPQELAQSGQLIMDFTNFLISLNVLQTDTINVGALLKNIGYFCCDAESRAVLHILINDLKQFGNQIIDGMKCLGCI